MGSRKGTSTHLDMGTYEVSMELHAHNRAKLLGALRHHLQAHQQTVCGIVLLQGGEDQYRYCTDDLVLFRQESYFAYLFGVKEPGFFDALDVASSKSCLFIPRLPAVYAVWLGKIHPASHFKEVYKVDAVYYVDEIGDILSRLSDEDSDPLLYLLRGLNTDSDRYSKPASFQGIENFRSDLDTLHPILTECRVIKSAYEVDLLRYVNMISSAGHIEVMRTAKSGMREYQLESLFLHYVYTNGGCRHVSYTCVCATGENSAVLHYGHAAAPNDRVIKDGDMALLDMGAEYHFYDSDITCSFPINGVFSQDQRMIYQGVLEAQKAVISAVKPGVSWLDMHELAERKILAALVRGGILNGEIELMMQRRLGAVFMPHGLGHFLGLDTHDPGGYSEGLKRSTLPGLKSLRTVRVLKEGMVLTVEPGCYFIKSLLDQAMGDPDKACFIDKDAIERFKDFGGVRLEDDIVVTSDGCENLTLCPRDIHDVEAVMAGKPWSPMTHFLCSLTNSSEDG